MRYSTALDSLCAEAHPQCSYVQPYGNLTLDSSEALLDSLFNYVETAVGNGTITQNCGEAFSLLYCHQLYKQCMTASNGSVHDPDITGFLCESDCHFVLSSCEYDSLTDLIDALDIPELPHLPTNCLGVDYSRDEAKCAHLSHQGDSYTRQGSEGTCIL